MSSMKPMTNKQKGQHNQQHGFDTKRTSDKPGEPQKNQRDDRDRNQSPRDQHDSQGDKPSR